MSNRAAGQFSHHRRVPSGARARLTGLVVVGTIGLACQVNGTGITGPVGAAGPNLETARDSAADLGQTDARAKGQDAGADSAPTPMTDAKVHGGSDTLVPPPPAPVLDAGAPDRADVVDAPLLVDVQQPDQAPPPPPPPSPPAPPAYCESPVAVPVAFERLSNVLDGDDMTFAPDGHLLFFQENDIARVGLNAILEPIATNVIGGSGGALRATAHGDVFVADFAASAVTHIKAGGTSQRLPTPVADPMKMVTGPGGALYITGQPGMVYRLDPGTGAITVAGTTPFVVSGLTFSLDYKTLYVAADVNELGVQALDVQADGKLGPAREWRPEAEKVAAMVTDECGAVYTIGDEDGRIRRLIEGRPIEELVDLEENYIWSMAFGSGQHGWDSRMLYVLDAAQGRLYAVSAGRAGQAPSAPLP